MDPILIAALLSFLVLVVSWLALPHGERQAEGARKVSIPRQRARAEA